MKRRKRTVSNEYIEKLNKPSSIPSITANIPTILHLDPSFWDDTFTSWQIIRLNADYRKYVDHVWANVIEWDESYKVFFEECLPLPNETTTQWRIRQMSRADLNFIEDAVIEQIAKNAKYSSIASPERTIISPVPYISRFPIFWVLVSVPGSVGFKFYQRRGRPQDLAKNLFVYELSQAGMKNMEIARILFGVNKSYREDLDKDPILVRIHTIKETIKKIVSQAYPIPQLT